MTDQVQQADITKMDSMTKKAFNLAVEFYEADKDLTRSERDILAKTYSKISYTTLGTGWATFFTVAAIPIYRQKVKTGSTKGANVSLAIMGGLVGMMLTSPYGAKYSYNSQLERLQETNPNCYKVAKILKPSESTKWMMYYKLTKDHPEHIMKDPRSLEAAHQRQKTIYSGRDPMGLYSGPRAEIARGPSNYPYPGEESAQPRIERDDQSPTGRSIDDDPFNNEVQEKENQYLSAWQKVRTENGIQSDDSTWNKVRSAGYGKQFSTKVSKEAAELKDTADDNQDDFEKLLEKERYANDEEENKRW